MTKRKCPVCMIRIFRHKVTWEWEEEEIEEVENEDELMF